MTKTTLFKSITFCTLLIFSTAASLPIIDYNPNGIIRHDTELAKYRELGNRPEFNCVGPYSESVESTDYAVGVLIAPNWVLTAQHFVQDTSFGNSEIPFTKPNESSNIPRLNPMPKKPNGTAGIWP
ncbi:hypothetical protein [Maribacter halichondriae]|uniref:hypothetical protein n=1 Tax=Maribacter halichondriae TaxID=2980554 RepID=UPI002359F85B|nr:hypothetical protein [Maribacter sp. Hal144]